MALNDWKDRLKGFFARGSADDTRRPDGGTTYYRPMQRRDAADAAPYRQNDYGQPVPYVHTGFTGMTPPMNFGGEAPGYGQAPVYEQTAWQPASYGTNPVNSGYTRMFSDAPEQQAARPEQGWFGRREEAKNNISYMPGFAPETAPAEGTHVEHIMTMTGLKSCYEAIECMKNGETVIVIMDAIANEGESMRCQDMLAGAAFTLGCHVRTLQGGRLVLIAPGNVLILPEQPAASRPEMPPVYTTAPAPQAADHSAARRERRTGTRAEEWQAARNGQMDSYNPYTGTMPVAAGAYGSFGGYGY